MDSLLTEYILQNRNQIFIVGYSLYHVKNCNELAGPIFMLLSQHATQRFLKKFCCSEKLFATSHPIRTAQTLKLRPPTPKTNVLLYKQQP